MNKIIERQSNKIKKDRKINLRYYNKNRDLEKEKEYIAAYLKYKEKNCRIKRRRKCLYLFRET